MSTVAVTDASFEDDVLKAEGAVLVDFWAEWCGPCKMIGPSIDELSEELADKVTIVKLDTEENPETPSKLSIRGVPTLILYKNGQEVERKTGIAGVETKARMKAWIEGIV